MRSTGFEEDECQEDIYHEDALESLFEEDGITDSELAFMRGYLEM